MSKFTKIAAGTLAALTITVGALATSSTEAHAWGKKGFGPGLGFGIAAGVIGAAAFAATAPSYGYGVASCRYVERYDAWGNYRGTRKVCDLY
jgi:hypothetical protein